MSAKWTEEGKPTVTAGDITRGLGELGLPEGAGVLVHSSLSRFGRVEGGAEAVIDALLAAVGPAGTVMMPTQPWAGGQYIYLRSQPVMDVRYSRSSVGAISEAFRQRPEAIRSLHPSHPVAAIGPLADYLLRDHENAPTCCGQGTPYFRNIIVGGYILFLGVDTRVNTTRHTLEELEETCDRFSPETFEATVIDRDGRAKTVVCRAYSHAPRQVEKDHARIEHTFLEAGVMKMGHIGSTTIRLIDARKMCDLWCERVRNDPTYWRLKPAPLEPAPPPDPTNIQKGMADVLWPKAPVRAPETGFLCTRHVDEDVEIDDIRIASPQNRAELIPAYLVRPRHRNKRVPAVVCLHGSGRSRELLVEKAYHFEREVAYLHGWARELARRGFVTLAITQRCYGARIGPKIQEWAKIEQISGRSAMGALVEDALCAVDYLERHCPEVDPERIGMAGFSLGGIVTFYSMVVDPRIRAAVPVCGGVGPATIIGTKTYAKPAMADGGLAAKPCATCRPAGRRRSRPARARVATRHA